MQHQRPHTQHPMLVISAAFAVGILLGTAPIHPAVFPALMVCAAAAAVFFRPIAIGAVILVAISAGAVCLQLENLSVAPHRLRTIYDTAEISSGEPVWIDGVVTGGTEPLYDGVSFQVNARRLTYRSNPRTVSGKVRVYSGLRDPGAALYFKDLQLQHGVSVRFGCELEREERYQNPGVVSRRLLLDQEGLDAACSVKSPLVIEKKGEANAIHAPAAWIYNARAKLIDVFRDLFDQRTAGVLIASLLGNKHFLDKDTARVFRDGGTFHILVISGLHITFIGFLTIAFVSRFTRKRRWQFWISAAFLWSYTIAVGGDVPVVRASLMFTLLSFSRVLYRENSQMNALGLASLILLAWRPNDLFNASFQLTVVSVGAIVGIAFPLVSKLRSIGDWIPTSAQPFPPHCSKFLKSFCEALYWRPERWKVLSAGNPWTGRIFKAPLAFNNKTSSLRRAAAYLFEGLLVSFVVQVCLLPLLVYYFHRVSPVSVLLNLWAGFLIAAESFSAIAALITGALHPLLSVPFVTITEFFNDLLIGAPELLLRLDAARRIPIYSGPLSVVYHIHLVIAGAVGVLLHGWDPFNLKRQTRRTRAAAFVTAILLLVAGAIVFHPNSEPKPDGNLTVRFLDVGQGDSIFITFPNGETMLIDGGGRLDYGREAELGPFKPDVMSIGEAVVSEVLWELGYSKVGTIAATHADADHIRGLAEVAENFKIGKAAFGRLASADADHLELMNVLRKQKISIEQWNAGKSMEISGVRVDILNPDDSFLSENNNSLVIRLQFGNRSILLTGDIEREVEAELIAKYGGVLGSDVLKAPHHGSRTSSTEEFIKTVEPRLAVISVGRRSPFGHPHSDVLTRLQASGAEVIVTGEAGMVTVTTDGNILDCQQFNGSGRRK